MKISRSFFLTAFIFLQPVCAMLCMAQDISQFTRMPLTPSVTGTYYYEGYDAPNNRYVYLSASGTYYYVDTGGNFTIGGTAAPITTSAYRVVTDGSAATFQFYNNHRNLYTFTSTTGTNGAIIPIVDFGPRSGTWAANDITFTHSYNTGADTAAIYVAGLSGTFSRDNTSSLFDPTAVANAFPESTGGLIKNVVVNADGSVRAAYQQPVVFTGSNINIFVDVANNTAQQAISINNGAAVYLSGGTISKTVTTTGDGSETIYMVGNQEGLGSTAHFRGENLTILSSGAGLETITMANGRTSVELYHTTITATGGGGPNTRMFMLNDQQAQGGASFYGENVTINNYQGRTFAFGYGGNTITLKNSTITASGTKGAVFRWITSEGTGGGAGGNEAMADGFTSKVTLENTNVTTTVDYAPIFQQTGRLGWATVTGGTLTTTGTGSPIIRLVGANDAHDESKFTGIFTNVLLDARNSSAIDLDIAVKDSANYGEDGGGVGKEVTTLITTAWDFVFISSTLNGTSAMRIATAGAHNSPYSNETRVSVFDSTINGRIEMVAGGQIAPAAESSGANFTLQAYNSNFSGGFSITGLDEARKIHQATLELTNCVFDGDVVGTGRGVVLLKLVTSPVTGNIDLSGATVGYLDYIDSPITGSVYLNGTAKLTNTPGLDLNNRRATIRNSGITGGFNLAGNSFMDLTLSGSRTMVFGGITASGNATAILRLEDNSTISGGVTLSGTSSVSLVLSHAEQVEGELVVSDRARLAFSTFNNTPIYLNRGLKLGGIWSIPGKTTLEQSLDITNSLGTIHIVTASEDCLILKSGLTGSGRLDIESIGGNALGLSAFRVIRDDTGNFGSNALILAHPVDYGLTAYALENRPDGAYLVGGLEVGSFGSGGAAVFNSQALAVEDWLASLAPLNRRMQQLRQTNVEVLSGSPGGARGDAGAFWVEARGDTTRINRGGSSLDFDSRTLGLTAGVDARWDFDTSTFSMGLFADTARTDRDFIGTADGSSDSVGGGVYMNYQHRKGLFISALARFDTYENTLNSNNATNAMTAAYSTQAGGLAFEAGWRFDLGKGWCVEPSYQYAWASLPGVFYTTQSNRSTNIIDITIDDAKVTQNLIRVAVSKAFNKNWSLHGYLAAAKVDASGGTYKALGIPNGDFMIYGDRIEASVGVGRQIGKNGRITLDVAYIDADNYERPCSVSLGYSHHW